MTQSHSFLFGALAQNLQSCGYAPRLTQRWDAKNSFISAEIPLWEGAEGEKKVYPRDSLLWSPHVWTLHAKVSEKIRGCRPLIALRAQIEGRAQEDASGKLGWKEEGRCLLIMAYPGSERLWISSCEIEPPFALADVWRAVKLFEKMPAITRFSVIDCCCAFGLGDKSLCGGSFFRERLACCFAPTLFPPDKKGDVQISHERPLTVVQNAALLQAEAEVRALVPDEAALERLRVPLLALAPTLPARETRLSDAAKKACSF